VTTPCQVKVAYGSNALAASPTYHDITSFCTSIAVRRGRQYLTDKTDAGTCDIGFVDTSGDLDPTNVSGAYWPMDPNCPAQVHLRNPFTGNLVQIFQGQVQGCPLTVSANGSRANRGTIPLVDLFALLALKELPASTTFDSDGTASSSANTSGNIIYEESKVDDRIKALLLDAGVPSGMFSVYTGNVRVLRTTYSPGYTVLAACQDAADAEWPGIANLFVSSQGIVSFRGRLARFDSGPGNPYGIHTWPVGGADQVASDPTLALLAHDDFVLDRDLNKIINSALFCPRGIADADIAPAPAVSLGSGSYRQGQLFYNTTSIDKYGPRSLTGMDLLTAGGTTGTPNEGDPLAETQMFGQWYIDNFKDPATRIAQATFRPVRPDAANAEAHWNMLCNIELGDVLEVNLQTPHGIGFVGANYFVEGISYQIQPGSSTVPNVVCTLDLSPGAYYTTAPPHWDGT
jgi:hypothetical protein